MLQREFPKISSTRSFQLDLPLPTNRTGREILLLEEFYRREKFPRYIGLAPGTDVLPPLEDGLRLTFCTSG